MTTPNLPEPLPQLFNKDSGDSTLTIHQLDKMSRGLRDQLSQLLAEHVQMRREERRQAIGDSTPTVPDIADSVKELESAYDVLDRIGTDFKEAAKIAREHAGDEALETGDGRVVVPDGDTDIVITPEKTTSKTYEPDALAQVLAQTASEQFDPWEAPEDLNPEDSARWAYRRGFQDGFATVGDFGSISWKVTAWRGLVKRLMNTGKTEWAKLLTRSFDSNSHHTGHMTVTREARKARRRS